MSTTTCPTCTRPANDGYVNIAADEACMDPCHRRRSRTHAIAEAYSTLCSRAAARGIPTSLDDPASPQTVAALEAAVAGADAEGEEHAYTIKCGLTGDTADPRLVVTRCSASRRPLASTTCSPPTAVAGVSCW